MKFRGSWFGLVLVVFSGILFGCNPTISKQLQLDGMDPYSICFFSQAISFFLLLILSGTGNRRVAVSRKELFELAVVGIAGMGATTLLLNLAYRDISVGTATCIHFTYPSLVLLVMALAFKERFTFRKLLAICCSLLGVFFLVGETAGPGDPKGLFFALCSAVTFSFYLIANGRLSIRRLPVLTRLTYANFFSALCMLPVCLLRNGPSLPAKPALLLLSLLVGTCGHILLNCGINLCGPALSAFASMSEPITSTVLSVLIIHESAGPFKITGLLLIILSIGFTAQQGGRRPPIPQEVSEDDNTFSHSPCNHRI